MSNREWISMTLAVKAIPSSQGTNESKHLPTSNPRTISNQWGKRFSDQFVHFWQIWPYLRNALLYVRGGAVLHQKSTFSRQQGFLPKVSVRWIGHQIFWDREGNVSLLQQGINPYHCFFSRTWLWRFFSIRKNVNIWNIWKIGDQCPPVKFIEPLLVEEMFFKGAYFYSIFWSLFWIWGLGHHMWEFKHLLH